MTQLLTDIYNRLYGTFGPQHWWPADSPFEVIIGAILTQNTNWSNVEKAIENLRIADTITIDRIDLLAPEELEELIRPSGFFRQKAARLQNFTRFLKNRFNGDLQQLFAMDAEDLRDQLLGLTGIGPETADSILLYAADRPSFVVDAYTQRIFARIGLVSEKAGYEQTRSLFMRSLPAEPALFNEYHALIVRLAKEHCRKQKPLCSGCPLVKICRHGRFPSGD